MGIRHGLIKTPAPFSVILLSLTPSVPFLIHVFLHGAKGGGAVAVSGLIFHTDQEGGDYLPTLHPSPGIIKQKSDWADSGHLTIPEPVTVARELELPSWLRSLKNHPPISSFSPEARM